MKREEAINIIKKNWPDSNFTMLREALETLIPELAESEDEKIRKSLISYFKSQLEARKDDSPEVLYTYNKWITWLEKQGEHSNFLSKIQVGDKVTRNENGVLVNLSQLERTAKKQDEQNMHLPSFDEAQGTPVVKQDKEKPAWNEEDEYCMHQLIVFCENCMQPDSGAIRCANWLKSLKDRVQPQWKPNADQLAALYCAIPYIHCPSTRICANFLYNDLKKLIEGE